MNEESTVQFADSESSYGYDKNFSFKDLILLHVRRITEYASCEMRGGFYEVHQDSRTFTVTKKWVDDTRERYSNAVEALANLLLPYYDNDMQKAEDKYHDALKKLESKYFEKKEDGLLYGKHEHAKRFHREARREACQKLFRELSKFLYREKYLELSAVGDE